MLDPFVALLSKTLSSPHSKVLTRALHCLVWVVRLPLPSLEVHVDDISVQLFALLRRYARAGMAVGNNRELVTSSFKVWREGGREGVFSRHVSFPFLPFSLHPSLHPPPPLFFFPSSSFPLPSLLPQAMTVIVRDFKKHEIKKDELQVLLSFVEEDIHDYQRQSTAFPLLKVREGGT